MNCPACDHLNVDGARYCAKCGALMPIAHAADDDPMIGSIVGGRYRITGLLGEGGMGRVYTGEQQMGTAVRKVAVKTLLQEFSKDPQVVARFMRECGTVVELEHPNTIKFYDFGQTDSGDLYIAMEYVDGQPLAEVIEREGALSFDRVLNIMKQICGSLHEAHDKGIVHRDLKPENVVLTVRAGEKDFVKVLDFGIAKRHDAVDTKQEQKLTQAGMVLGTPPYMSPEQFTGKGLDRRSDIYALGVMAYEMLTGQLPFKANTPWEWATQHMTAQPSPFEGTGPMSAQIPPHMKEACMRALSKDSSARQPTAKAFMQELTGDGRASIPLVSATAPGGAATEAFTAAVVAGGAGAPPRAGATQIGEPFVPPIDAGVPPPMGPPVGAPMGGSPHQAVPTAGGQAIPAPPVAARGREGGSNKGVLIAAAGLVAALLVVGIVMAVSGGGETETDGPLIPTGKQASTADDTGEETAGPSGEGAGAATDTGSDTTTTTTGTTTKTTTQTTTKTTTTTKTGGGSGTAACDEAISAAMGKNCAAARAALNRCSGPKQGTAAANVNKYCKTGIIRPR